MKEQTFDSILLEYIQAQLIQRDPKVNVTTDTQLIQSGLIDSLTLFKLIAFVQKQFGVKIEPSEITLENFATIRTIRQLVESTLEKTIHEA